MRTLLHYLLISIMAVSVYSCVGNSPKEEELQTLPNDDFSKALSEYTQGLLVFEDDPSEGFRHLTEALSLAPQVREIVDDWILYSEGKVLAEEN